MKNTRLNWRIAFIIVFIALMLFALGIMFSLGSGLVDNGEADLSSADFKQNELVALDGHWEFYWDRLLMPDDFITKQPPQKDSFMKVPGTWDERAAGTKGYPHRGVATYRLRLNYPSTLKDPALRIRSIASAYKLYANGQLIAEVGKVSDKPSDFKDGEKSLILDLPKDSQELELIFQVANLAYARGGIREGPVFGSKQVLDRQETILLALQLFFIGSVFIFGIYYFLLFLLQTKNKTALLFSMLCFTTALRSLIWGATPLMILFPNVPYDVRAYINYLTGYNLMPIMILFVLSIYPLEYKENLAGAKPQRKQSLLAITASCHPWPFTNFKHPCSNLGDRDTRPSLVSSSPSGTYPTRNLYFLTWYKKTILVLILLPTLFFDALLLTPPEYMSSFTNYLYVLVLLQMVYIMCVLINAVLHKRDNAILMFIAIYVFVLTIVEDILYYKGIGGINVPYMFLYGNFAVIIAMSFVQAKQQANTYKKLILYNENLVEADRLKDKIMATEMSFLQAQIKPHFLYNALNAIANVCEKDGRKAGKLIVDLAIYLRGSLEFNHLDKMVTIEKELEFINTYFNIEQARFGQKIQLLKEIEIPSDNQLPVLILQPLVENAVRHGISKKQDGGRVIISVMLLEEGIGIKIEDDGIGIEREKLALLLSEERKDQGVGLLNIHHRLLRLYGRGLDISSEVGRGTCVRLVIPERENHYDTDCGSRR